MAGASAAGALRVRNIEDKIAKKHTCRVVAFKMFLL
jgi:hypothetical protein